MLGTSSEEEGDEETFDYRMIDAYDEDVDDLPGADPSGVPSCLPCHQLAFRTGVVLAVGAVTEAVPDLALVIDLFGAVFGSTLAIIIPNYLSMKSSAYFKDSALRKRHESSKARKTFVCVVTVLFGFGAASAVFKEMSGTITEER